MQLPERYWEDVDRYTGEILAGLPADVEGRWPLTHEEVLYAWEGQEEGTQAQLRRDTYRMLGLVAATHHHLGITSAEPMARVTHFIRFDPVGDKIVRVQDDIRSLTKQRTLFEYATDLWKRDRLAKHVGIFVPTPADYTLLRDELRRGAESRFA